MTISKLDWSLLKEETKNKLLELVPKKDLDSFCYIEENQSFAVIENPQITRPVGCLTCLEGEKGQDDLGNITLGGLTLLNYKDLIDLEKLPTASESALEMAPNVWICPNCERWIFDYLPKYDTIPTHWR
jgi:hypothetical protein